MSDQQDDGIPPPPRFITHPPPEPVTMTGPPPEPAAVAEGAPAPAVVVEPPPAPPVQMVPVPAGPYRIPDAPLAPHEFRGAFVAPRKPRTILGPALAIYAVMLWSFVIAGQFTTSWFSGGPLPAPIAGGFVFVTTVAAWIAGLRDGQRALAPRSAAHMIGRAFGTIVLAFMLFVVTLFASAVIGSAGPRNHDFLIAFLLVFVATIAAVIGRRATWPIPPDRTQAERSRSVLLWLAGALVTLVAGAQLAVNG